MSTFLKIVKNFFNYNVVLTIFLSFILIILYGSLLRHYLLGGSSFIILQKPVIFLSEFPIMARKILISMTLDLNLPPKLQKHVEKKNFDQLIKNPRDNLLVLSRYDHSLKRSVVDIIDLENFKTIHRYSHDINEMNKKIVNIKEFPRNNIDNSESRFLYRHPLLLDDGSLISNGNGPQFKIDFCSNLVWLNDEEKFHHSSNLDNNGNIWQVGELNPYSKYIKKYEITEFIDTAIIKMNTKGKILYKKSILEILIENKILPDNIANTFYTNNSHNIMFINEFGTTYVNPIHLNDIQPALSNTEYWKTDDLFLSIKNQSAIIHYRPSTNEVINYITGPFSQQHDVDIISDKEISIFNNNNFHFNNEYSEILIYDFSTKKFRKLFDTQLREENFKTITNGLSHIFKDGALLVEEQNHGRLILFNNQGKKEWEFVNKDKNGDIGYIKWSRIIEDQEIIYKFKSLLQKKQCSN